MRVASQSSKIRRVAERLNPIDVDSSFVHVLGGNGRLGFLLRPWSFVPDHGVIVIAFLDPQRLVLPKRLSYQLSIQSFFTPYVLDNGMASVCDYLPHEQIDITFVHGLFRRG